MTLYGARYCDLQPERRRRENDHRREPRRVSWRSRAGRFCSLILIPQANASSALGHDQTKGGKSIYHGIIGEATHEEVILPSQIYNYHFIPAAPHLAGALVELVGLPEREYFLRKFVNRVRHRVRLHFDRPAAELKLAYGKRAYRGGRSHHPGAGGILQFGRARPASCDHRTYQDNLDHPIRDFGRA